MTPKTSPILCPLPPPPLKIHKIFIPLKNIHFSETPKILKFKILNPKKRSEPTYIWKYQSNPPPPPGVQPYLAMMHPPFKPIEDWSYLQSWYMSVTVKSKYVSILFINTVVDPLTHNLKGTRMSKNKLTYGKCSKISNNFLILFSNKVLIFRAGIHKILVRIANREDPDQTASSEAVWSGTALFV